MRNLRKTVQVQERLSSKADVSLRTRTCIKRVFVSTGREFDVADTEKIALECSRFKLPEPLRLAHGIAVNLFA